jgi:hypothetical protein
MLEAAKFSNLNNDREHMGGVSSLLENPQPPSGISYKELTLASIQLLPLYVKSH